MFFVLVCFVLNPSPTTLNLVVGLFHQLEENPDEQY